ncbi:MFS transporter [Rummeliibacillus sp. JY-2-4R]
MKKYNVNELIEKQHFNGFHALIIFSCAFIMICDGYDMFMFGTIVPSLMDEWGITSVETGRIGSFALIGMMVGALFFGPLADRIGRKIVILICTFIFSLFTFTSGFSHDVTSFGIQRLIAGIGLGGAMPNLVSLVTEYAPKKYKSIFVAIMFSGHPLGGVIASFGGLTILPNFGWRAVIWVAILPIILLPIIYKTLPESPAFYILRNKKDQLLKVLNKLDKEGNYTNKDEFVIPTKLTKGVPVKHLFKSNRALSTIMFWVAIFMCLLVMYGLSTWLPSIMMHAGFELGSSMSFLLTLNAGALIGSIIGAWLADRFGLKRMVFLFLCVAFVTLTALSFNPQAMSLYILIFLAGATTTGAQIITNAFVSQYYPTEIRSTGSGWSLGIGRIGGMLGPIFGGILLAAQLATQLNFLAFAIPCIIAAIAILFVQEKYSQKEKAVYNEAEVSYN